MAASVRVEDDAFSDTRFDSLAMLAGLADADHARGKMIRIWRQCTMEGNHMVSENDVKSILGKNGVEALLESRLAERVGDSGMCIRIRGTNGRIEWLKALRDNGKRGGRPKKCENQNKTNPKPSGYKQTDSGLSDSKPDDNQNANSPNPPAPAPIPAPSVNTEDKDIANRDREPKKRERDPMWDAIVAITGADASLATTAGRIGKVKKELLGAQVPYTPEEVLSLPGFMSRQKPWAAGQILTLGEIVKNIHLVRADGVIPIPGKASAKSSSASKAESMINQADQALREKNLSFEIQEPSIEQ